jgi:hypothetical protein
MNELYNMILGFGAITLLCLCLVLTTTLISVMCAVAGAKIIEYFFPDNPLPYHDPTN